MFKRPFTADSAPLFHRSLRDRLFALYIRISTRRHRLRQLRAAELVQRHEVLCDRDLDRHLQRELRQELRP